MPQINLLLITLVIFGTMGFTPSSKTLSSLGQETMQSKWTEFAPKGGAFSVLLPGTPEEEISSFHSPLGRIEDHLYFSVDQDAVYHVDYSDIPALNTDKDSPFLARLRQGVFKETVAGILQEFDGSLLAETVISLDGHPGREIQVRGQGDLVVKARIFLVRQRVYVLDFMCLRPNVESATAKFLDSFKLTTPSTPLT